MLYFDIDQRALVRAPGSDQWIGQNRGKRGDTLPLSVTILRGAVVEDLEDVTEMVFAVKAAYGDADPLILADDFTEAAGVWTAPLAMNTEGVDAALGELEKIDLLAEFSVTCSLGTISSQVITFPLYKDLWTGEEGTPLALPTPEEWLSARAVRYDEEQSLTDPQKAQVRTNIGLGTAATRNTGTSEGDLPLLGSGGKLPSSLLSDTLADKTLTAPVLTNYTESVVAIGNSSTAQTIALTNGTFQTVTLTGNCTFTMPTATAGKSFILKVMTGAGGFTATFTGVKWPENTAPVITTTASRYDLISFVADGTAWSGSAAQNFTP